MAKDKKFITDGFKEEKMVKILFSKEIAERLGVHRNTVQKREFQERIGLPKDRRGNRIAIPEPVFDEWVLNGFGANRNETA